MTVFLSAPPALLLWSVPAGPADSYSR
jgi:hypothetical protein